MNKTADEIVRALAEYSAPIIDGTYANGHDWCTLCGGEGVKPEDHDEDCPWRLAREYAAQPQQPSAEPDRAILSGPPWTPVLAEGELPDGSPRRTVKRFDPANLHLNIEGSAGH